MIEKFSLNNFKSYYEAELPIHPLTVLIGANASGKSNVIEGLQFLSWLAQGQKLSALRYLVNQSDRVVRGSIQDLPTTGTSTFRLGCTLQNVSYGRLQIELELRETELRIREEKLLSSSSDKYLYRTKRASSGANNLVTYEFDNFAPGGKNPTFIATDQTAQFTQLSDGTRIKSNYKKTQRLLRENAGGLEQALQNILFLDPVPGRMREYSFKSERTLRSDGSNLSGVLFHLIQQSAENREILLQFIQSLPEQNIEAIEFLETERGECMVRLVEHYGASKKRFDAGLLSDGTLRVLAFAAALLSVPEGGMIVIEEVDNGVHPSRMKDLIRIFQSIGRERKVSIVITSHSPALLDVLPAGIIPEVIFCYRDPQTGFSQLKPLHQIKDYPELIMQDSLGDLLVRGMVDHYVKHPSNDEQRIREGLQYLDSIR